MTVRLSLLAEVEASPGVYAVQQSIFKYFHATIDWQFQQINACAGAWESSLIATGISNTKPWI